MKKYLDQYAERLITPEKPKGGLYIPHEKAALVLEHYSKVQIIKFMNWVQEKNNHFINGNWKLSRRHPFRSRDLTTSEMYALFVNQPKPSTRGDKFKRQAKAAMKKQDEQAKAERKIKKLAKLSENKK